MQRLGFSSNLCFAQRQPLLHYRTALCRQRGVRLVCPAGSAVADAPPKRKPGRPKKQQTEDPSAATDAAAAEPKKTQKTKKTVQEPDSDDEEMPVPRAFKAPWESLSDEQIAQQNAELEALQRVREAAKQDQADNDKWRARESQSNKFIYRDPEWLKKESKLLIETKYGWVPRIGYYGKGKPQWWPLRVQSQKRLKAVAEFMTLEAEGLPNLESAPGEPRLFEPWLPSKVIKSYSLRTEKMGTKTVKWELGQKMLVKAVMDQELYDLIDNNIYIAGFPDDYVDIITDRNGVTHVLPKPYTAEDIAKVEAWLDTKEVRTKDEVMLETFGHADESGANAASNRMDTDEEYVEYDDNVDDEGLPFRQPEAKQPPKLKRYKDDTYMGSYNNPSNWYRGTSEAEAGAGQKAGPGQKAGSVGAPAPRTQSAIGVGQRAGQDGPRGQMAKATQDSPREERVGQTPRVEARQEARMGSAQDRRAARGSTAWNQDRSNKPEQTRRGQKQPRDRGFNPRDWEGSSSTAPATSPRQRPQQQPSTNPAEPSSRPERTAAWWLDGKKPNAAGEPGLDEEAGLDEWEPTGAGRKGWYNPQSSSSAAATKETRPVNDPMLNPGSGSGSGSGDRWRREEASRANSGQPTHSRNQEPGRAHRQKDSYRADWSQRQHQPGNANKAPGAESSDYDNQLQKPVLQGRAKEIKEQPRGEVRMKKARSRDLPEDRSVVGKRGAVGKSGHYDPIQKFDNVKLTDRPFNWTREEENPDADAVPFEMPSFKHLEGQEWTSDALQFNNMSKAPSGSHLDQWKSAGQDWRANAQSLSRGNVVPPSQQPAPTPQPSLTSEDDPFAEAADAQAAKQNHRADASSHGSAQQPEAAIRQGSPSSQSPQEPQATPSNAVSWDTGSFDFTDMNTDAAEDLESGIGRNRRVRSRAETRQPARERKQGQSQGPRGRGAEGDTTQQSGAKGSSGQQDSAQHATDKPDDDFESFWDQF